MVAVHHWNTVNKYHKGLRKLYLPAAKGRTSNADINSVNEHHYYYRMNLAYAAGILAYMHGYGPEHQREQCAILELRIPPFSSTATFGHQHHSSLECFGLRINQASDNSKPLRTNHVAAYLPTIFILRHPRRPYPSLPEYVV